MWKSTFVIVPMKIQNKPRTPVRATPWKLRTQYRSNLRGILKYTPHVARVYAAASFDGPII